MNDEDYQPPFNFTGKLNKIMLTVDRPQLSGALYTFDILLFAGPKGVVANQSLHQNVWLTPPIIVQPTPVGRLPIE